MVTSHRGQVGLIRRPGSSAAKVEGISRDFLLSVSVAGRRTIPEFSGFPGWAARCLVFQPETLQWQANMDIIGLSPGTARSGPGRKENAVSRQSDVFFALLGLLTTPGFVERLLEILQGLEGGARKSQAASVCND